MFIRTRKRCAAALAVLLSTISLASPAAAIAEQQARADLNGDGVVDVFDFVLSKRAAVTENAPISFSISEAEGAPGEVVTVTAAVSGGTGFTMMSFNLNYDAALDLGVPEGADHFIEENTELFHEQPISLMDLRTKHILYCATPVFSEPVTDAELFRVSFRIPEDAQDGTVYQLIPEKAEFFGDNTREAAVLTQRGRIKVSAAKTSLPPEETVTTAVTTTTTETSATTTTTTTTTTTVTTTTVTATTSVSSSSSTTKPTTVSSSSSSTVKTTTTQALVLPSPEGVLKRGIDVSFWQGNIDFKKIAKDPHGQFAMLRAGYGKYAKQEDPKFQTYYKDATAAGVPVGAYWYSYAMTPDEARIEAHACAQVLGDRQFGYPIAYDVEDKSQNAALLSGKMTKDDLSTIVDAFCSEMEKLGYYVVIYTNPYFRSFMNDSTVKRYDVWVANWRVTKPNFKESYGMWQYGSTHMNVGTDAIAGIPGECDLDLCYRDYPAIMKQKHLNGF